MNPLHAFAGTLRRQARIILLGAALLIFGTVSFRSLFLKADDEIAYDARMAASFCAKSGACTGIYELAIGNTGKRSQERITAVIRVDPAKWAAAHNVSDLAADQARSADPGVKAATANGVYTYEIENLTAGTELKVKLTCSTCSLEELTLAKETPVDVRAHGTVLQGDARVTTLGRRLKMLLTFL